ncbi:MAG: molybdopterin molybdotransferase MoeA [Nitrospira sp.]|nr:molybdopterin molybdotransferase MoeA [Candidatus Manganitrophaceae bacterium]HIL33996.1 molybdopterin molybdenumtransferase MoeA [Candidatus Manganitrophaceae bacterium]
MKPNGDPIEDAWQVFLSKAGKGPLGIEKISILSASGRILAEDIVAEMDDPPYARSIMEGYLVSPLDISDASKEKPVSLGIAGDIPVGSGEAVGLGPGKAFSVTTGSYIPSGEYSVIKKWDVQGRGDQIVIDKPTTKGENIEAEGSERKKGDALFSKGTRILGEDIFLLASQGVLEVKVANAPRVAIFSSGNEVIPPTAPFRKGAIWDCNSYGLSALIRDAGGVPVFKGIIKDDFDLFREKVKEAFKEVDMVVISGGTAVDGRDFTADLLNALEPPGTLVNGIPMRSGKPIVLGVSGVVPIVCVAGHPPEAARGFNLFGRPMMAHLMGECTEEAESPKLVGGKP